MLERETLAYDSAMRVYCALEDRSAFADSFEWPDIPDYRPE
jgi:hypothetical protein